VLWAVLITVRIYDDDCSERSARSRWTSLDLAQFIVNCRLIKSRKTVSQRASTVTLSGRELDTPSCVWRLFVGVDGHPNITRYSLTCRLLALPYRSFVHLEHRTLDEKTIYMELMHDDKQRHRLVGCLTARQHRKVNLLGGKLAQSANDGQQNTMHITLRYTITM